MYIYIYYIYIHIYICFFFSFFEKAVKTKYKIDTLTINYNLYQSHI